MNDFHQSKLGNAGAYGCWKAKFWAYLGGSTLASLVAIGSSLGQSPFPNNNINSIPSGLTSSSVMSLPDTGHSPVDQGFMVNSNNPMDPIPVFDNDAINIVDTPRSHHGKSRRNSNSAYCMNDPCAGCRNQYFAQYEAVWLTREGDRNFTLTNNQRMTDFEFELAGRYTIGQRFDCLSGFDISYSGPFDWLRSSSVTGSALFTPLTPAGGYVAADIDAFNNALSHTQVLRTQLQGFEFNRRWYSWDIMSTYIGVRGFDYEEDYTLTTVGSNSAIGFLSESVDNFLIGAHIGTDLYYPLSQRLSLGAKGRFGVYANFDEATTFISNGNVVLAAATQRDVDLAGSVEYATMARYRILPNVVATAGYEFLYLTGVATVANQNFNPVTPSSGNRVNTGDDAFFHGGTAGLHVSF